MDIAYTVHDPGHALLVDTCWLSHLQFDRQSPVWRHDLVELGRIATVVRYDERGHGLSDRGVTDHSLQARVASLDTPVPTSKPSPTTPGLERSALLAMAQGGPVAREYAARHPQRVTRLIFRGNDAGAQTGASPEALELDALCESLTRAGRARPTSKLRRVFSRMTIPGGTEERC